ncbi:MAG TPA: cell wall hydrolase [Sphingomonas sp.]|uniref:cell wall hydrolase n=1 Tax=Sphingomonas sp. TaxID=28214 RepID=UPI002BA41725|nr:cell wall hydrolase [Sphingomonas sp.]HMI19989.1 cell wall hydrolase [Sphingomonas sp.]
MTFKRPITLASGAVLALTLSGFALSSGSSAAELVANTPLLAYDLSATIPSSTPAAMPVTAQPEADDTAPQAAPVAVAAVDPAAVECMAKVVMHEANNQPREGKIAVAQTLVNRLKAGGRFGGSICDIANQKGQFFHIASFRPRRDTDGWQEAVEVAHQVLAGQAEPVAPGAMYFRASYAPANAFFRTRQRVTTVGAHVFYR